jgi:hypothetical protein
VAVRARLLASHRLTDYQQAEKLVAMPALGAEPAQLRILLTKNDLIDLVGLAEHADDP